MTGISIIIPTLNRTTFLKDTLDDLFVQEFEHPYEILIVDQSAQPDSIIINHTKGNPLVQYCHITQFRGLPEARNFGAQKAKYDVLVYVDDDIECDKDFIQEHYNTFLSIPDVAVVAGGITEKFKNNPDGEVGKFITKTATPLRSFHKEGDFEVDHGGGGNFGVRKEVYLKVNGVDENLTKGAALYEETDFCLRVKKQGGKIWFNSKAHVYHLAADTGGCRVPDIDKYLYNLVRNRTLIIERHLSAKDKLTAKIELFRLVLAHALSYKKPSLIKHFFKAGKEGKTVGKLPAKMTKYV